MQKLIKKLFGNKPEPAYHFTIGKMTGTDEQTTVTFNGFKGETETELVARMKMIGAVLQARLKQNNDIALEVAERIKAQAKSAKEQVVQFPVGGEKGQA